MSFQDDLNAYIKRTNKDASKVLRGAALELFGGIMQRTPVKTGRARGNWNAKVGSPDTSTNDTRREGQAASAASGAISEFAPGDILCITNNLPYIGALEYGHSKQADRGMVRVTAEEFRQAVRRAASNVRRT